MPVNFWTLHSFQFGATLDMLLFMRVLGLRTRALRLEALDANRERDVMRSLAHTDPLTGLPNRRGLNISLASALSRCSAEKMLAVYVMDLDGFKPVNDQHGHDVGDELLVAVARRLQGHLRQSDLVARLGGDEFVVMAGQLQSLQQAQELGHKLLDAFRSPFSLNNVRVEIGLTIGYAIAPHDSTDAIGLLKLADAAMYSGKQGGKFCLRRNTGPRAVLVLRSFSRSRDSCPAAGGKTRLPFPSGQSDPAPVHPGLRNFLKDRSPWPIAKVRPASPKTHASRTFYLWRQNSRR